MIRIGLGIYLAHRLNGLPELAQGMAYVVDEDGRYLVTEDGAYIIAGGA